jgi:glycosyltransferase involved in cell wall biosynthesis
LTEVVSLEQELSEPLQNESGKKPSPSPQALNLKHRYGPNPTVALVSKFPPSIGGEAEYFYSLATSISKISPAVAVANYDTKAKLLESSGKLRIFRVWRLNSLSYPLRILRTCLSLKPRLIHANHEYMLYGRPAYGALFPLLLLLLRLTRTPIILTMHSVVPRGSLKTDFFRRYGWERLASIWGLCFMIWTRLTLRLSNHVIVHSQASKTLLCLEYGCRSTKISVIGHGVATFPFTNQNLAKELLKFGDRPIVLQFGFLHEKKGTENLLRSLGIVVKKYPNALLVVVGGPHISYRNDPVSFREFVSRLRSLVKENGLENNVLIRTEYVPDELAPIYFASADIVALPYIEHFGASGVLARAMAMGKAVVATRVNPFSETIDDGVTGILVKRNDETELANAIDEILSDSKLRETLGRNLKDSSNKLSWQNVAIQHLELYSQVSEYSSKLNY